MAVQYVDAGRSTASRLGQKGGATNWGVSGASDQQWRSPREERTRQVNQRSDAGGKPVLPTDGESERGNQSRSEDQREPDWREEVGTRGGV